MRWEYGEAYKRHDMAGEIRLPNDSVVQVCDWIAEMPDFMRRADTIFVDPPWNMGNVRTFYTKAEKDRPGMDFPAFSDHLWRRLDDIRPATLFVEMGKEYLADYLMAAKERYRYVTFYNSTYYRRRENKCYVIHATNDFQTRRYAELEDKDEAEIIAWVAANHPYGCIGDLCMGQGLIGKRAYDNGRSFVGTELNYKRLAVLVDYIAIREHMRQPMCTAEAPGTPESSPATDSESVASS